MRAAIIPALDEEAAIAAVVESVQQAGIDEVIVADNGSADATACRASAAGARVVREMRRGYGAACLAGIAALRAETTTVVFIDLDGSDDPSALPALVGLVESGEADLAIGSRLRGDVAPGALTLAQRIGNRLAGWLLTTLYGSPSTDLGPMRAVRAEVLRSLDMRDRGFGWTVEMQARAAALGYRTVEVPVTYRRRRGGRSKISGTFLAALRAGATILWTLLSVRLRGAFGVLALGGLAVFAGALAMASAPLSPPIVCAGLVVSACGCAAGLSAIRNVRAPEGTVFALVAFIAVLARLPFLFAPAVLEDDVYRYLWDGAVVASGESPYRFSPQEIYDRRRGRPVSRAIGSEEDARLSLLAELSRNPHLEPAFLRINYPSVPTIYPPVAEALFAILAMLAPGSVFATKLALAAFDLATMAAVIGILRALGSSARFAVVYAWSPLVLVSFVGSAHVDVFPIAALLAAILLGLRNRRTAAGLLFGVAVAAKLFPLIAWPALRRLLGWRGSLAALVAVAAFHLPWLGEPRLFEGLVTYASTWSFNSAGFALVEGALGWLDARHLARPFALLIAGGVTLAVATPRRLRTARGALRSTSVALAALVLLAPAINPWYVAWLVPFCAVVPSPALLTLSFTALVYYALPANAASFTGLRFVEFGVPALVAIVAARPGSAVRGTW